MKGIIYDIKGTDIYFLAVRLIEGFFLSWGRPAPMVKFKDPDQMVQYQIPIVRKILWTMGRDPRSDIEEMIAV